MSKESSSMSKSKTPPVSDKAYGFRPYDPLQKKVAPVKVGKPKSALNGS